MTPAHAGTHWTWRWALTGLVLVGLLTGVGLAATPERQPLLSGVTTVVWLGLALTLVLTTLAFLMQFQLTGLVEAGWLSTLLVIATAHTLSRPLPHLGTGDEIAAITLADLLLPLSLISMWALQRRIGIGGWRHPLVIGLLGGAVLMLARAVELGVPRDHPVGGWLLIGYEVVALVAAGYWILRMRTFPGLVRINILAAVLCTATALQLPYWAMDRTTALAAAALLGGVGIVLLLSAGTTILQWGLLRHRHTMDGLVERTHRAEHTLVATSALLEDLRTSLIGLNHASRLLAAESLSGQQHERLQDAVHAELTRLEQLLHRPVEASPGGPFDVDLALLEGVRSWRASGRFVELRPAGLTGWGSADHLASTVHTLLGTVFAGDEHAQVSICPAYAGAHVLVNVEVYGRHAHFLTTGGSPESGLATIQTESPLSVMRNGLRIRGGDMRWVPTPRGADFTLALRR